MASMPSNREGKLPQECNSSLERKHQTMLERLAAIQDSRQQQSAIRRAESAAEASPLESTQQFLEAFSQSRAQVENVLSTFREKKAIFGSEADKSAVKHTIDELTPEISKMEKLLADKSYFLPAYEVRASQSTILKLREDIENANAELLPKKKFSFKNKAAGKELEGKKEGNLLPMAFTEERKDIRQDSEKVVPGRNIQSTLQGIQDAVDRVIVQDLKDFEDGEYTISNLVNCKVYLKGRLRALFVHNLKGCHVFTGPVAGSVLIEEVDNSILMLASHQIRIHHTKNTDFYLRVRSRPIVEYTSGVRFAPYAFGYYGIQDDLEATNLSEETGMWGKVDDFRWLRAVPSPNWSILPGDDRLPYVDGSNVIEYMAMETT